MLCVNERQRSTISQFVIVKNKLTSVFHSSVMLLTMGEFLYNIVKVVCRYKATQFDIVLTKFTIS